MNRLGGCLTSLPLAIIISVIFLVFGSSSGVSLSAGIAFEVATVAAALFRIYNLMSGVYVVALREKLLLEDKRMFGQLRLPASRDQIYFIFFTPSRTLIDGEIEISVRERDDFPFEVDIPHAFRRDIVVHVSDSTKNSATISLRPGWRQLARAGDFEPLEIRIKGSLSEVTLNFNLMLYSEGKDDKNGQNEITILVREPI